MQEVRQTSWVHWWSDFENPCKTGPIRKVYNFLLQQNVQTGPAAQPVAYSLTEGGGEGCVLSPELNWPGREDHNSPSSNTKKRNNWKYTSAPYPTFQIDNFTAIFPLRIFIPIEQSHSYVEFPNWTHQ